MKKLLIFFAGLILLLLSGVALYFAGALFDAGEKRAIEAFVFQPNNLSESRIGRPVPIEQLSDKFIRERLIRKFVHEYFYIIPDSDNIAQRTRSDSVLASMSLPAVFSEWKRFDATEIEKLANKKAARIVIINDILLPPESDYWEVHYELYTWPKSNDMELVPTMEHGLMHMRIKFEKGVREERGGKRFDIQEYLDTGGDPASIFKFRVEEIKR